MALNLSLLSKTGLFFVLTVLTVIVLCFLFFQTDTFVARVSWSQMLMADDEEAVKELVKEVMTLNDLYVGGFVSPVPRPCAGNVSLLAAVTSAPANSVARQAIRDTWGRAVVLVFMVGLPDTLTTLQALRKEGATHGDIAINRNWDTYRNLTLKTTSMFEWMQTFCSQAGFVLKTDDDMFINVRLLMDFVDSVPSSGKRIYGRLAQGWGPIRDAQSKYYLSKTLFPPKVLPPFTTGPAYLMTSAVPKALLSVAFNMTFLPLEDVFFTGVVAERAGVERVAMPKLTNVGVQPRRYPCTLHKNIAFHEVTPEKQHVYWTELNNSALDRC